MTASSIDRLALIIGAQKCGTTSLFTYLASHPEVAGSTPKELDYFTYGLDAGRDWSWYCGRWRFDSRRHRVALEASTSYTRSPQFPCPVDRITATGADFRFLYILRDPIGRIESVLRHRALRGTLNLEAGTVSQELLAVSRYAMQVGPYVERFGADCVLLADFDELRRSPAELLARICEFLELKSFDFSSAGTAFNVSRKDHPLYRALSGNRLARALAGVFPPGIKQRVRLWLADAEAPDVSLNRQQRALVRTSLADDVRCLQEVYGFDTSGWTLFHADG